MGLKYLLNNIYIDKVQKKLLKEKKSQISHIINN